MNISWLYGNIHTLRQHNFGLFLTHPPTTCLGTPRQIRARQGPIFYPKFFRPYWNPKSRKFGALPVVALLMLGVITCIFGVIIRSATVDFQMMCDLVKFNSKYFALVYAFKVHTTVFLYCTAVLLPSVLRSLFHSIHCKLNKVDLNFWTYKCYTLIMF